MALTAWLFPGQGAQFPSMGRAVQDSKMFDAAEQASGLPLRAVMAQGPATLLRRPDYLEPCIVALQAASVDRLRDSGAMPDMVAGYSLGEIGALYCAGCLTADDALKLAVRRGRILAGAGTRQAWRSAAISFRQPPAAVPVQTAEGVYTACYNSDRDFTITGEEAAVSAAEVRLAQLGATVSPVETDGPWHSPLALEAAEACAALLEEVPLATAAVPVCLGSAGVLETDAQALRRSLSRNIQAPVLWSAALDSLWEAGVRSTLEIAPGHTLTGFVRNHWSGRGYEARFMERAGGRVFDFRRKTKECVCER